MAIKKEQFANSTPTTLSSSINDSVTTITVADGSTFPLAYFRVRIENEILYVTTRSSNTLTVVRGYEGTTAAGHASGIAVTHTVTAGALQAFRRQILGECGVIDPNESVSSDDDDFDDESFSNSWIKVERSGYESTIAERDHHASIIIPGGTSNAQHYGFMKAKTFVNGCYIQAGFQIVGGGNNYPIPGIGFSDGVTYGSGKLIQFCFSLNENAFFNRYITGWNTQAGEDVSGGQNPYFCGHLHLRLIWNSSGNYTCQASPNCISWINVFTNSTRGGSWTPTHAGIITTNWGSTNPYVHSYSYFRYSW